MNNSSRRGALVLLVGVSILCLAVAAALLTSDRTSRAATTVADVTVQNQPAAQGRPVTPAGTLLVDATTRQPAIGSLPVDFVRSPDTLCPDGGGRYLIAVNSGFGVQFNAITNRAQQSLAVIDLNARPAPAVVQNVYFPTPQSANVGAVFDPLLKRDHTFTLYVSGGFENKIWVFRFLPDAASPITPPSPGPNTTVEAPFIDVSGFSNAAPTPNYNDNRAPVYPTGLAISPDGDSLYVANNLGDSLGIINNLRGARTLTRIDLRRDNPQQFIYPYGVAAMPTADRKATAKLYVSCWNDASIAVIDPRSPTNNIKRIAVERHPTAMLFNRQRTRLYVVNSNADSVSVINTGRDEEVERVSVRLAENALIGTSPEGLALSADESTLYVANAHAHAIASVRLSEDSRGIDMAADSSPRGGTRGNHQTPNAAAAREQTRRSVVRGLIPTGQYPSAVAVVGGKLFIGNGKGTGFANSSMVVDNSGRNPNVANDRFPAAGGRRGGQYSVSLVAGNISVVNEPDEVTLSRYTQQVMRNDGMIGSPKTALFKGRSPIKHMIYIIKENRTYDQVYGDLENSGDGQRADGDPSLAIFGAGDAARLPGGIAQNVSPNHRALALRFGLLDRFFVNSEASPDGHNWSTAAFSNDYIDKAYRWDYSGRGRTYDYEGFNRLPSYEPPGALPPVFDLPTTANNVAEHMRRYIPYLNGSRDVGEPETLYLWDAAKRAGLTYRNYGEFVATISTDDVKAINTGRPKQYPDLSPIIKAFPTKKSLEGNHSSTFHKYDLAAPDALTIDSYRAAKQGGADIDPTITGANRDERFRGSSRFGEWLAEFQGFVADLGAGRGDRFPNLTIMHFPNDHTSGLRPGYPTPQFHVADNDYAVGKLVEAVSNSPYWKDTAIFIVEDDAQDGPDHVDAHRSVALVISAYNRPGALVHQFHNTVSLIRTMEILLGLPPMNQLDASAVPIDVFQEQPDLRPYQALLPEIALDNLIVRPATDRATRRFVQMTAEQDLAHADMANPRILNEIIWFSIKGDASPMPEIVRLPIFDAMRAGIVADEDEAEDEDD